MSVDERSDTANTDATLRNRGVTDEWCESYAMTFVVNRSQPDSSRKGDVGPTCWTALSTTNMKTLNEGIYYRLVFIPPVVLQRLVSLTAWSGPSLEHAGRKFSQCLTFKAGRIRIAASKILRFRGLLSSNGSKLLAFHVFQQQWQNSEQKTLNSQLLWACVLACSSS